MILNKETSDKNVTQNQGSEINPPTIQPEKNNTDSPTHKPPSIKPTLGQQLKALFEPKNSGKLAAILVVIGVVVTLYPVLATLVMNQSQITATQNVKKAAKDLGPEKRKKILKEAEEYNKQLQSGPILDPFLERVAPDTKIYQDYLQKINMGEGIMGSVTIPKIRTTLPIYHGTYDKELELGAGHLFGSSLPVGGKDTHAVITAHSGLGEATMFDYLPKVEVGDRIYIDILDKKLAYRIISKEVVIPTDTKSLYVQPGKDLITLVTCTPYGINTHRLLVHAERIPYNPELDKPAKDMQPPIWRNWMIIPIILSVSAVILLSWLIKKAPRKNRDHKNQASQTNQKTDDKTTIDSITNPETINKN